METCQICKSFVVLYSSSVLSAFPHPTKLWQIYERQGSIVFSSLPSCTFLLWWYNEDFIHTDINSKYK